MRGEQKTGEATWVQAPGAPRPGPMCEAGAGVLPVSAARGPDLRQAPQRINLIWVVAPSLWFGVCDGTSEEGPNLSKLS